MPSDESKGSQLDAIGSLAQRQLDNTETTWQRRAENILAFAHTIGARTLNAAEEPTPPES